MTHALRNINLWIIIISDAFWVTAAYYGSYLIRFEGVLSPEPLQAFTRTVFWIVPLYLVCFTMFNLYRGIWRYTSVADLLSLFKAVVSATAIAMIVMLIVHRFDGFSRSVFIINGLLVFLLIGGFRIFIRLLCVQLQGLNLLPLFQARTGEKKKLLIIGAGSAGEKLIRELQENKNLEYDLVGLIDDNPKKYRQRLHGVPVLGNIDQIDTLVNYHQVDEIAIAITSASPPKMRRIIDACKKARVVYKTVPGIGEIIEGKITIGKLREIRYEDLLHRAPTPIENDQVCSYLTDKRVMVTGGAGSIGSELCRQIAAFSPRQLIIVERNESALYELTLDIQSAFPEIDVVPALAAVQNTDRMEHFFRQHKPQMVFHAAAYKHVPMIESHPWEAIFNNVVGSHVVLKMCHQFGVDRCVMMSTDKAVRPTNVMGATKRFMELLIQSYASLGTTRYMAVRFGNVLGSVGSVLPLFQKQIADGGPVTVTDPRMMRFFMTIPEACRLILQCGAYGRGGEIYVLKMGTPVRINDMAHDMITRSGYRPGQDIEIKYTGMRPGEKLYEELITYCEGVRRTDHEDIMVLEADRHIDTKVMQAHVNALVAFARQGDAEKIKQHLCAVIPEYCPWTECQIDADADDEIRERVSASQVPAYRLPPTLPASSLHQIDAEGRLLLQLLSVGQDGIEQQVPIEAVPIAQWEKLIQRALRYDVAPLLYLRLKRAGKIDRIPLKIRSRLRKIYLYFAQISVRHQHWVVKALELLDSQNVPALVLNGIHLSENVYRNVAARQLSRVTLLVPKEGRKRVHRAIACAAGLLKGTGLQFHAAVDLHWPGLDHNLPVQEIWRRARSATISGCPVKVLCPEDLLLYLCLELALGHRFSFAGIRTLCDIQETLYRYSAELDWDVLAKSSRALKVTNAVGLCLMMACELFMAPVAPAFLRTMGTKNHFKAVKQFALKNLFGANPSTDPPSSHLLVLWKAESVIQKCTALCSLLFSTSAHVSHSHIKGYGLRGNLRILGLRLVRTAANCAHLIAMALASDAEVKKRIQQDHQNSLICEWLCGKRQKWEALPGVTQTVGTNIQASADN